MTGDIELGTLESVNDEVPAATRRRSMKRLREFQERTGYHVHSIVSAHLNDVRVSVWWPDLFRMVAKLTENLSENTAVFCPACPAC